MKRLHVAGASAYDVVVGHDLLAEVSRMLGDAPRRVALIHSEALPDLTARLEETLSGYELLRVPLPEGEGAKSAAVAVAAWEALGEAGFTRSDAVVSLGGGATTDMAGFIAATWLRGVRVVHVPTTLLAMVDAAVGGKTGMNTSTGKNLVGSFHEPAGVVCDLSVLQTLPRAELVAGLGEVIKCGFIADPEILTLVEADPAALLDPASAALREVIERAIAVKIEVVVADLKETGGVDGHPGREVLNYGHTLAHAIERHSGYRVRHGEAVAIGCCFAAELGRATGHLDDKTADRHARAFASVGLPVAWDGASLEDLLAIMRVDKKVRGNTLRMVILRGLADPMVLANPAEESLRTAYAALGGAR